MLKKKKHSLRLTLGAAVLLIGGGVALIWLWQRQASEQVLIGAEVVPQDALLAASISTESDQWEQLRSYGTAETQAALNDQLARLNQNFLAAQGYNYEADIKPWLGKQVTLAYLPAAQPTARTSGTTNTALSQLSTLMVLPIEDPLKAQQLLDKRDGKAPQFTERTYKGVQIRETKDSASGETFSTAVLGRSLVVTTDSQATERAIDTHQGSPSLATTPGYAEALREIRASNPFAHLYLNVPTATTFAARNSARSLSADKIAEAQQQQGIATTVSLEPEGFRFKGISWLQPNSPNKLLVANDAKTMPRRVPSDTLLMMSGGNFQQLWQSYTQGAQSNPLTPIKPENIRAGLKSTTNLDLEQDLLPWMQGEFSLSIIPKQSGTVSDVGVGLALMVQASDRNQAETTLQQLDRIMTQKYQLQVQAAELGGNSVVHWVSNLGGITATRGWLDGNVAFLTLGAPIADTIVPQPQAVLADNELFKQMVSSELSRNNGSFFIDFDRTINAGNMGFLPLSPEQRRLTGAIRGIGVTSAAHNERSSRFDVFVLMKKATQASSLPSRSSAANPLALQADNR